MHPSAGGRLHATSTRPLNAELGRDAHRHTRSAEPARASAITAPPHAGRLNCWREVNQIPAGAPSRQSERPLPVPGSWPVTYPGSNPDLGSIETIGELLEVTVDAEVVDGDQVASEAPPADFLHREEEVEERIHCSFSGPCISRRVLPHPSSGQKSGIDLPLSIPSLAPLSVFRNFLQEIIIIIIIPRIIIATIY